MDYLDLQALFNLSWFHSISVEEDINLKDLKEKKRFFTEEDKEYILLKQREILAQILPLYKALQDAGRIEITTTPYYHPILPLLCDTDVAKVSIPDIALPRNRFSHPEDAKWQLTSAIRSHAAAFGSPPRGMWPSEGSVSEEALDLISAAGIDWVVTDEDILFRTLSHYDERYRARPLDRRLVYQPYRFARDSRHINLIFRDKNLSNLISFNYSSWDPDLAALDLLDHFQKISGSMRRGVDSGLATIVMDGENAWEYYDDNGRKFFELV